MFRVSQFFSIFLLVLAVKSGAYADTSSFPGQMTFCYENQSYLPFIRQVAEQPVRFGENGALVDLVIKATESLGIQARFVNKPWKRCIHLLREGEVDGIFAAIWQKERDAWGVFPKRSGQVDGQYRLWRVDYKVYSRPAGGLSWDGERFKGVVAGVSAPLGYVAEKKLVELGVKSKVSYLPVEGLHLVNKGRLDGYVLESTIGRFLLSQEGLDVDVREMTPPFFSADWFLPLSFNLVERYPDVAEQFWQALARVRDEHGDVLKANYPLKQ